MCFQSFLLQAPVPERRLTTINSSMNSTAGAAATTCTYCRTSHGKDARLSFGAARHTWASRARRKNIAISVISEGLGHTTERTTRIYLEEMEPCRIDEANRIVTTL